MKVDKIVVLINKQSESCGLIRIQQAEKYKQNFDVQGSSSGGGRSFACIFHAGNRIPLNPQLHSVISDLKHVGRERDGKETR